VAAAAVVATQTRRLQRRRVKGLGYIIIIIFIIH
jgi:hypothetical protein